MLAKQLACPDCNWLTTLGAEDIATRLRLLGHLRRDAQPDDAMLQALLETSAQNMTCPACKRVGLLTQEPEQLNDDDWQAAVLCEVCRKPIPPERIEVAPHAKRCVPCQTLAENDALPVEPDFCPRCGALVELRVSHAGGRTRYRRFCKGDSGCRLG